VRFGLAAIAVAGAFPWLPFAPPAPKPNPTTLAATPTIERVAIDVVPGAVSVLHEIRFPAGALSVKGSEATLFYAFPAQERPLAIEVTTRAAAGATAPKVLSQNEFPNRPPEAAMLIGPEVQAGFLLHLAATQSPFLLAISHAIMTPSTPLRMSEVDVMIRLGSRVSGAMPLENIEVTASHGFVLRGALAYFCGQDDAHRTPLRVQFPGYPAPSSSAVIDPLTAPRTPTDDLCLKVLVRPQSH
jgi:hypothetical protein